MTKTLNLQRVVGRGFAAAAVGAVVWFSSPHAFAEGRGDARGTGREKTAENPMFSQEDHESGAQLWAENCGRCHNVRSPSRYSDAQWEVIVHHMRVRANLTGAQQRAISAFLKTAN